MSALAPHDDTKASAPTTSSVVRMLLNSTNGRRFIPWLRLRIVGVKIVIYQKPTCTTCRQVYAALKESGVDFDSVDYYLDPIPRTKLKELLRKMGITPRQLLRTKEPVYKALKLGERELSDDEIVDLMVDHPDLIQRPIVEKGSRAILARPAERLKEII